MNNFTFYSPTYFAFGKEEENNAGKYVRRFGGTKVLIHYGNGNDGTLGGFVVLQEADMANIYRLTL